MCVCVCIYIYMCVCVHIHVRVRVCALEGSLAELGTRDVLLAEGLFPSYDLSPRGLSFTNLFRDYA